jgi:hypothetical protein
MTNWTELIFNAGVGESAENASGSPDQFSCHHRDWRWVIVDFAWGSNDVMEKQNWKMLRGWGRD